jgi:hypothetical protein
MWSQTNGSMSYMFSGSKWMGVSSKDALGRCQIPVWQDAKHVDKTPDEAADLSVIS